MFQFKSVLSKRLVSLGIPLVGSTIFFWPALRTIRFSKKNPEDIEDLPSKFLPPTEGVGFRARSFRCLKQVQAFKMEAE